MEDINYIQIDTWQITIIIVLLIITMVSMLLLMGYFYLNFIKPLREVKPTNNNHQQTPKRGRGRPSKRDKEIVAEQVEASHVEILTTNSDEDRLVKAVKKVPLPKMNKEDLKKLRDIKLTKPREPEEWMSELDVQETDE